MQKLGLAILAIIVATLMVCQSVHADDLFSDNFSRDFKPVKTLSDDTTIGGYPIYQGGRSWQVMSGESAQNNVLVRIGHVTLLSPINSEFFMQMNLTVNMSQNNGYYTTDMCSGSHLVAINFGGWRTDNCMTIDPLSVKVSDKNITVFSINIRNSQQGSRLYNLRTFINLAQLGFPQSAVTDWTEELLSRDAAKKALLDKTMAWAKKLQDGVNRAIAYDKPKNAFDAVPPISELLAEAKPAEAASPAKP